MDFAQFKEKLAKSREVELDTAGAKFRLRLPTEHAWRLAFEQHKTSEGHSRVLLEAALVGWEGVLASHFLVGESDAPVAYSPEAKAALLDERQDIADDLMVELMNRVGERRAKVEEARKNSSRAPSGT